MTIVSRIMVFIDGRYFHKNFQELFGHDKIRYALIGRSLAAHVTTYTVMQITPDLVRTYYYDAVYNDPSAESVEHKLLLESISNIDGFEVRTGLVKTDGNGKPRQKGVDTLIALDMLSKAYQDHYDIAILVAGDYDFLEIVRAVKNAGKRVFGAYYPARTAKELIQSFDYKVVLDKENFFLHRKEVIGHPPAS